MKINPTALPAKGITKVSRVQIFGYALGDSAVSITMNGVANFAMLYYTQILGLGAVYAGVALGITTFWDAVTDPIMGHITDNTRTCFGRRVPYMVFGGAALALSFFLLWLLPAKFNTPSAIFCCVLLVNLLLRTALTIFVVPYTALGFEMCPEYTDRARLQGARYFINQITNLVFGAMAWTLFFQDSKGVDGTRIDGTAIARNYLVMGATLAIMIVISIGISLLCVRKFAIDNRAEQRSGNSLTDFLRDFRSILTDRLAWFIFGFLGFALLGMMLTAQVQMFTYIHYMKLSAIQKSLVHGAGMLTFALASLNLPLLVRHLDKKRTAYLGMTISSLGGIMLFAIFTGGIVTPQTTMPLAGVNLPLAVILFGFFQSLWWGGCGILMPLAQSMIADISEINSRATYVTRDGSYASVLSFFMKAASSTGLLITGSLLSLAGIVSNAESQSIEASRNIAVITFLCGPAMMIFSFMALRKYPVDQAYMQALRENGDKTATQTEDWKKS
jgi:glycoside/pentoside/hexuronide:cation symporter, GPH family